MCFMSLIKKLYDPKCIRLYWNKFINQCTVQDDIDFLYIWLATKNVFEKHIVRGKKQMGCKFYNLKSSCTFGKLLWFWWQMQKNDKILHGFSTLKRNWIMKLKGRIYAILWHLTPSFLADMTINISDPSTLLGLSPARSCRYFLCKLVVLFKIPWFNFINQLD